MGWFSSKPKPVRPSDLGAFLSAYIPKLLKPPSPVDSLRNVLTDSDISDEYRETFDINAFFFICFVAYASARRRYPIKAAEEVLSAALEPLLAAGDDDERADVRDRFDYFRSACPPTESLGQEMGSLTALGCIVLFGDESDDFFVKGNVAAAVVSLTKMFDGLFDKTTLH